MTDDLEPQVEPVLAAPRSHRVSYQDCARTGPGTLGGRYLRMFWQPVHRSSDLAPGRAIPLRIMGEDFTLYRGEGGAPEFPLLPDFDHPEFLLQTSAVAWPGNYFAQLDNAGDE
ncbi:MAG TPA: hypothetical protein VGK54_05020 [Chloroflexota bacterium]